MRRKSGMSLAVVIVTIVVVVIFVTTIVMNMNEGNVVNKAEEVVGITRFRALEHAVNEIVSDYYLYEEIDETVREKSVKDYVLERLKLEYNLTEAEALEIEITEDGRIKYAD